MIQFSFGGSNLPKYTFEIYIGNAVSIQKLNYLTGIGLDDQQGLIFITTINGTVIGNVCRPL